jgi:hypothetical protein
VISRRTFLAGSAAAALLAACGGDDDTTTSPDSSSDETVAPLVPDRLGAAFADGYSSELSAIVAGIPQRAPFIVVTGIGEPVRGEPAPASIDVEITRNGATVTTLTVPRHTEGIPTPYYPVVFTPPEPGDYEIRSDLPGAPTPFRVGTRDELAIVQIGDKLRPVDTPTTTDARGVEPVCTRTTPGPCPFHDVTLTEALAAGTPVAFMISTPGFCQTAICGPVLELLVTAAADRSDLTVVHAEVYVAPEGGDLTKTTEAVSTYGLGWEPSFYVADATGTVTARLDFLWDETEFDAALASAV